jgi:N-acetylneuraminic acid mutarotase
VPISKRRVLSASLFGLLLGFAFLSLPAAAQTTASNEWTWIGGSSTVTTCEDVVECGQPGVYGILGTPATDNIPGGRTGASNWTDSNGHFWLFGGVAPDAANGYVAWLNDLWEFNSSTNEWAWMGGSQTDFPFGVYGELGKPAAGNIPGNRASSATWTDANGNLWLFGGAGAVASGNEGDLNDLWKFNLATNEWAWMGGSSTLDQPGVYGKLGTPAAGNIPGARDSASSWTDRDGNLWLFGGESYYELNGILNDLWEFNPTTNEWTWMGGSSTVPGYGQGQYGVYGKLGTPDVGNFPGSRSSASNWTDNDGHFWLFGGGGFGANGYGGYLNDLWEFNPSLGTYGEWTWMGGSSQSGQFGVYGTLGTPAAGNQPGSRDSAAIWTDSNGHLWLFGGEGIDANGSVGYLNDLLEFSFSKNEWVWMGGSNTIQCPPDVYCGSSGVYGTLGTPAAGNIPGGRDSAKSWTDSSGNLWLFGGERRDANNYQLYLNDFWEFQPSPTFPISAAATPIFSPMSGTYSSSQTVTITDATTGVAIYYTTDGVTTPTTSSTQYTGTITVSSTETIQAIAVASGYSNSAVASATYTIVQPGITITGATVTITAGATTGNTSAITLTPVGGFTGSVALTAAINSGPSGGIQPTLSFNSTTPAGITGAAAGTATLTITTKASSTTQCSAENRMRQGIPWYSGGGAVLACVLLIGIPARRRNWLTMLGMLVLLVALAGGAMACGGGGGGTTCTPTTTAGTMPGIYTITITGTSGSTTSTGTVSLTVQ